MTAILHQEFDLFSILKQKVIEKNSSEKGNILGGKWMGRMTLNSCQTCCGHP